jgi:hypothetical protein
MFLLPFDVNLFVDEVRQVAIATNWLTVEKRGIVGEAGVEALQEKSISPCVSNTPENCSSCVFPPNTQGNSYTHMRNLTFLVVRNRETGGKET